MSKKKIPWQVRQGDVVIEKRPKPIAKGAVEVPREDGGVVLAHGEVTGHKHQFRDPGICELRNESSGERVVVVDVAGLLEHEEHVPPIQVGSGSYDVIQQCEYNWAEESAKAVVD